MAVNIRPIEDFNLLTYHYTEVIFQHLYATKGPYMNGGISIGASIPNSSNIAVWGSNTKAATSIRFT